MADNRGDGRLGVSNHGVLIAQESATKAVFFETIIITGICRKTIGPIMRDLSPIAVQFSGRRRVPDAQRTKKCRNALFPGCHESTSALYFG
ncbi:hypothetical protein [Yoonia vestfoldensis]|uniref:hypothetical protein n=1 Tax=Yoonia vestfoldensis TaxID=245188 RepID=UPI001B7FE84D|nr:hypothetical protein [Yoonia vestfoldensis]